MKVSYFERIVRGSAVIFIMYFLGGALGYVLRVYLANNLSVNDFGLFYAVLSFVGLLSIFKDMGFSTAMTKFIAEYNARNDKKSIKSTIISVILIQVLISVVISLIVIALSDRLAVNYFKSQESVILLKIILLSYIVSSFVTLQYVFQGLGKIGYYSVMEPLRNIAALVAVFLLIHLGVTGVAYSYLISGIVLTFIISFLLIKIFPFFSVKAGFDEEITKKILIFSVPVFMTSVGSSLLGYTDTALITYFLSLDQVALYQVALPTSQLFWVLISSISIVILPVVAELWAKNDKQTLSKILSIVIKFTFMMAIPFLLVFVLFADILIRMFFGTEYMNAVPVLQILTINSVFYALFSISAAAMLAIGRPENNVKIISFIAVLNLALNIILIPVLGIVGAALATTTGYVAAALATIIYLRKYFDISVDLKGIAKSFAGSVLMFIIVSIMKVIISTNPWIEMIIIGAAGILFYFAFIYITNVITKEEFSLIKKAILMPKLRQKSE